MRTRLVVSALAIVAAGAWASQSWAADISIHTGDRQAVEQQREMVLPGKADTSRTMRVHDIVGLRVENPGGESLGKIEDLVIDPVSGTIKYAALSFGGFLGLGDKYFAVPWQALSIRQEPNRDKDFVVLDVSKERLKQAPGFDKNRWPDLANPEWAGDVDKFYGSHAEKPSGVQRR